MTGKTLIKGLYRTEFSEEEEILKPTIRLANGKFVNVLKLYDEKKQFEDAKKYTVGTGHCYGSLWVCPFS